MLRQLTADEITFLTAPPAAIDAWQDRLTQALAATLRARLRLPLLLEAQQPAVSGPAPAQPRWQVDETLATLWLTRRLGGHTVTGTASFVPQSLIHNLDSTLAERWLDGVACVSVPPALAWMLTTADQLAPFSLQLPRASIDVTLWARGVIRHD